MIKVYLPNNFSITIVNSRWIYIYNINNYLIINAVNYSIFFNKDVNKLLLQKVNVNKSIKNKKFLSNFLFSWENFFSSKIYFLGKGYKIKKYNNESTHFYFNHSHINCIVNSEVIIKKVQKVKLIIFSKKLKHLIKFNDIILNIRKINSYTKRGIRLTKMYILKKRNKSNVH